MPAGSLVEVVTQGFGKVAPSSGPSGPHLLLDEAGDVGDDGDAAHRGVARGWWSLSASNGPLVDDLLGKNELFVYAGAHDDLLEFMVLWSASGARRSLARAVASIRLKAGEPEARSAPLSEELVVAGHAGLFAELVHDALAIPVAVQGVLGRVRHHAMPNVVAGPARRSVSTSWLLSFRPDLAGPLAGEMRLSAICCTWCTTPTECSRRVWVAAM